MQVLVIMTPIIGHLIGGTTISKDWETTPHLMLWMTRVTLCSLFKEDRGKSAEVV